MTERKGTAKIVWGILLMVLIAPLVAGLLIWLGVSRAVDAADDIRTVAPDQAVTLEAGRTAKVAGDRDDLPAHTAGATCTVTGPGGSVPFQRVPFARSSAETGDSRRYDIGSFTPTQAGEHHVSCPPHATVRVDDHDSVNRAAKWGLGGTFAGLGLGGLLFLTGLILLIVGIVQKSSRPRNQTPPPGWVSYQ